MTSYTITVQYRSDTGRDAAKTWVRVAPKRAMAEADAQAFARTQTRLGRTVLSVNVTDERQ